MLTLKLQRSKCTAVLLKSNFSFKNFGILQPKYLKLQGSNFDKIVRIMRILNQNIKKMHEVKFYRLETNIIKKRFFFVLQQYFFVLIDFKKKGKKVEGNCIKVLFF